MIDKQKNIYNTQFIFFSLSDLIIKTLEGIMRFIERDYIIKGAKNEFYPYKPDIFEKNIQMWKNILNF